MSQIVDNHGRQMRDLRISITDRCNFRCAYCVPAEGLPWLPSDRILSCSEIVRLASVFVRLGVTKIRLTGGEPLVRPDLPSIVRELASLHDQGLGSLSLTTNGYRLAEMAGELAAAGLTRINVSLDSLVREKFRQVTRRDGLDRILAGLETLERYPSLQPIKVNCVAVRGFTDDEILDFAGLARSKPYIVRFIEYMPLDAEGNWRQELVLPGHEVFEIINAWMPLQPIVGEDPGATARRYRFADGRGEIGFINSVTEPFCGLCSRIRLTADGQLRTCLFALTETDLLTPLRAGASDDDLAAIILSAAHSKELKHRINDGAAFRRSSRSMCQIGG